MKRRLLLMLVAVLAVAMFAGPSPASASGVSREEAIRLIDQTRQSIDETLALLKSGNATQALAVAKNGYLSHFELVETPLRVADNELTITAEFQFATIRTAITDNKPIDEIRSEIIKLRDLLDKAERALTDAGLGAPALVTGQSFLILFREGFEVVLLMSVLLGYLEAARSPQFIKPVLIGVGLAVVATVLTVLLMPTIFGLIPIGREVLEAFTALLAVAVLFYVSFWLIARLEHRKWMEFVRARLWSAVSVGSTASLMAVGFTAVYREGFETALFYQSLLSFGQGLGKYILLGIAMAVVALAGVAYVIFKLGRKVPVRTFMNAAVAMVMLTSIAFLGNAMHTLQAADVITFRRTSGPRLPIFLAEATGVWPTMPSLVAQIGLAMVYLLGGLYTFVVRPRLANRPSRHITPAATA
ncbi:MAG: FTR1 family protein [Ilumatobacteraceae bacterium]